jgi:uncharacterized protein
VRWTWSERKNLLNRRKHGLDFETARFVFDDPFALSRPDPHPDGDRWQTVGWIEGLTVFVVHTWSESQDIENDEQGRIISARKATTRERTAYDERDF